jgi:uncharacterized membrane protein YphA (DoxX/SURF4 family)
MKKYKIIFWLTTGLIFVTQGVMELFMLQNEKAVQGIVHLGYPAYFFTMLVVFKVLGVLALVIPQVPVRVKEWAYAGFGIDFVAAIVSVSVVDGFGGDAIAAVIAMVVLLGSYISYHKLQSAKVGK